MKKTILIFFLCFFLSFCFALAFGTSLNAHDSENIISNFAFGSLVEDTDFNTCSSPSGNIGTAYYTYDLTDYLDRSNIILTYSDNLGNHSFNMSGSPWTSVCDSGDYIQLKVMQYYSGFLDVYCEYPGGGEHQLFYSFNSNSFCEQSISFDYEKPSCSLSCPGEGCIFYDNMNYSNTFEECGYQVEPQGQELTPTYEYFFSPITSQLSHSYLLPANFYPKVSDKFTLNFIATAGNSELCGYAEQSGYLEHQLIYQSGLNNIPAYDVTFYYDTSSHYVSIFALMPGNYLETIASDVLSPYYDANIRIDSYYYQTPREKFYNLTSLEWQYFNPNSYSIYVNDVPVAYNVPFPNTFIAGESYIPKTFDYLASNCVLFTDLDISGSSGFFQQNETGLKENNDFCSVNSDCVTGLCNMGRCSQKGGGSSCNNDFECLSGSCNGWVCSAPSLWQTIDSGKTSLFGNDEFTNDFISLLIAFLVFALIFGGSVYLSQMGAGLIVGGASFMALCIFFAIVGWLSPFILFGEFLIIAVIVFIGFSGSKGG